MLGQSTQARRPLRLIVLLAILSLTAIPLAPTVFEFVGISLLPWASLQSILAERSKSTSQAPGRPSNKFKVTFDNLPRKSMGTPNKPLLAEEYQSANGLPPKGYEAWLEFAKKRQCHLGPYTRIDRDLEAFRDPSNVTRRLITTEQVRATKLLPRTVLFMVRNGTVHAEGGSSGWRENFSRLINGIVQYLPDIDFVVNELDEPRILPGTEDDMDARYNSKQCSGASKDFLESRQLHGTFNNRPSGPEYHPFKTRLPLFSQSKINECHSDITFPTYYGWDSVLSEEQHKKLLPWEQRRDTLYFRGSTTGGAFHAGRDYSVAHRQRLVEAGKKHPHMDIKFTAFIQCGTICGEMEERYGKARYVTQEENFKFKYLVSIDGNSFVSRLPRFMSSGSVPFRIGIYSEWFDEWIEDRQHYLRVDLDFGNLEETLAWAMQHDREAQAIGARAQRFARTRLRNDDMECYMYRLLLEYAAILE